MKRSELTPREKAVHTHGMMTGMQVGLFLGAIITAMVFLFN